MKMPDWIDSKSGGPDADGLYWMTVKPKRWFALYPSFWRFFLRTRQWGLKESPPIEHDR